MAGTSAPDIPDCRDLSPVGEHVARTVYTARHDGLDRPVTITVYPPLEGPDDRDRFESAAAAAQRLGVHPSVLTLHAWGVGDTGAPWIVTDRYEPDAADRLLRRDGPFEIARALEIGVILAGAVETAHRSGIVHGDISPSQIVFSPAGEALLSETGLSRFARLTGIEAVMAPIRYHAPPEVLEGTATSPATDIYSLGSTIYALLVGRAPQEKAAEVTDSNASLLLRILQLGVPAIERPGVPPGLDDALRAAMAPQPVQRTQSAGELARALQDAQRRAGLDATEAVVLDEADLDRLTRTRTPRTASTPANRPSAPPAVTDAPAADPGRAPHGAPAPPTRSPGAATGGVPAAPALPGDASTDPSAPGPAPGSTHPDPSGGAPASLDWPPPGDGASTGGAAAGAGPAPAAPPAAPLWQWSAPDTDPPAPPSGPPGGRELPAWFTDPLPSETGAAAPPSHPDRPPATPPSSPGAGAPAPAWGPNRQSPGGPWGQGPSHRPSAPAGGIDNGLATSYSWPGQDLGAPHSPPGRPPLDPGLPDPLRAGPFVPRVPGAGDPGSPGGPGEERPALPRRRPEPPVAPWSPEHSGGPATRPPSTALPAPLPRPTQIRLGAPRTEPPPPTAPPAAPQPATPRAATPSVDTPRSTGAFPGVAGGGIGRPGSALERARQARARRQQAATGPGARPAGTAADRPASHESRPAAREGLPAGVRRRVTRSPAPPSDAGTRRGERAARGPLALPVIVLVVVVVLLALGAAWVIITGDDAPPPASTDASSGGAGAAPAGRPTGTPVADVTVSEIPAGTHLEWPGTPGATYVVRVLSPLRPPERLGPVSSPTVVVPPAQLDSASGNCFEVTMVSQSPPGDGALVPLTCVGDATEESVRS